MTAQLIITKKTWDDLEDVAKADIASSLFNRLSLKQQEKTLDMTDRQLAKFMNLPVWVTCEMVEVFAGGC